MNTKDAASIIKCISKEHGVSEAEVRGEMEIAIQEGYKNPDTRVTWSRIFGESVIPTPEEFILVMMKLLQNRD